jgi:cbb3-type cytochrome oxidase subunit 3
MTLEPVSVGLKFGFLAVLYLFLLWVAWSALRDLRRGRAAGTAQPDRARYTDATGMYSATDHLVDSDPNGFEPRLLVERAPGHQSGTSYDVSGGATLGRGDVEIQLEDPFASSQHARIARQGHVLVIEDLGSTNGTYLNEEPLNGPQPLRPGDRIRIGDCEFSYQE